MPNTFFASTITLEGRTIGPGHPVFIIAEIGVNHNGDIHIAKKMIDEALRIGVDCVKFQTFRAEEFMSDPDQMYEYKSGGKLVRERMFDMFKRLEMSESMHAELFAYARKQGLVPMTSVADPASADMAEALGVPAFKLSSEDLINLPLVEYVASKSLPLLLSTGMADGEEIDDALDILRKHDKQEVAFLHCVSLYPTPDEQANMARLPRLSEHTNAICGYSDHTQGVEACVAATALGACILEKHYTLDRNMDGPDHSFSADPQEIEALIRSVRRVEIMRGPGSLAPFGLEKEIRKEFRRSVVAVRDLPTGHLISRDDLTLKRPGKGLRARDMHLVLGKTLTQDIAEDGMILPEMVQES